MRETGRGREVAREKLRKRIFDGRGREMGKKGSRWGKIGEGEREKSRLVEGK